MANFSDMDEPSYEEKRKNAELQLRLKEMENRNRRTVALIQLFGVIFVAALALIPTNSSGDPYKPVIEVVFRIFIGDDEDNNSSQSSPTPNIVETSVAQTLTAIASTAQPQEESTAIFITITPTTDISTSASGLFQCDLEEMINTTSTVADLIVALDNYYGTHSDAGSGWSSPGFVISGPAVFWTDLFENGNDLPSNVSRIRTQGSWGVFSLQSNTTYTIDSPNGGGRFFRIIADDCSLSATPSASTLTPITPELRGNLFISTTIGDYYCSVQDPGRSADYTYSGHLFVPNGPIVDGTTGDHAATVYSWDGALDVVSPNGGNFSTDPGMHLNAPGNHDVGNSRVFVVIDGEASECFRE